MSVYDSLIIGGGPAGMTAALYMLRSGKNVAVVEKLAPGGQLLKTAHIENYPGFVKPVGGFELADAITEQLMQYPHERITDEVAAITQESGLYLVRVGERTLTAKTVIVCSGARYKHLGVPGEERLIGKGISFCALCDGNFFRGQTVGVVGGGDAALEESLYLSNIVGKIHLIHRRSTFRGSRIFEDKVRETANIALELNTVVAEVQGENEVSGALLKDVHTGETRFLPLQGLFVFIGFDPEGDFLPAGLERDKSGFIITDCEMRTNLPGFFAAGDIRSKMCRQVATAVGDGATAAQAAYTYLETLHG